MVVKLRLARLSKRHQPFYNIVVAKDRSARDSKPMEVLGTYNPVPQTPLSSQFTTADQESRRYKDVKLDITRTKYWLGVGAQPSEGVQGILGLLGLWEGKPGTKATLGRMGGGEKPAQGQKMAMEMQPLQQQQQAKQKKVKKNA